MCMRIGCERNNIMGKLLLNELREAMSIGDLSSGKGLMCGDRTPEWKQLETSHIYTLREKFHWDRM